MATKRNNDGTVFKAGAVCLAFLIIGYQVALFVHRAAALRVESLRDHPDTVFVYLPADCRPGAPPPEEASPKQSAAEGEWGSRRYERREADHGPEVERILRSRRRVESFRFDPNTVSMQDLQRLGFSEKQARSIINYRQKGGRFRRKSDFAKSFVVADSVFRRLEPFIVIPKVDINRADSAAFDALPGIGPWFAARMVRYREELGGYSCTEQLMDIYRFDREKYDAVSDLVCCSLPASPFGLWTLPAEELRKHPYIKDWQTARGIVIFRENNPKEEWTVEALSRAGVIDGETAVKLSRCRLAGVGDGSGQ